MNSRAAERMHDAQESIQGGEGQKSDRGLTAAGGHQTCEGAQGTGLPAVREDDVVPAVGHIHGSNDDEVSAHHEVRHSQVHDE